MIARGQNDLEVLIKESLLIKHLKLANLTIALEYKWSKEYEFRGI